VAMRLRQRVRAKRAEQYAHLADGAVRFAFGFAVSAALVLAAYNSAGPLEEFARKSASAVSQNKPVESRVLLAVESSGVALQVVDTNSAQSRPVTPPPGNRTVPDTGKTETGRKPPTPAASAGPSPEIRPGSSPRPSPWNLSWPELGAAALLAMLAYEALIESGKGARHDSPKFVDALNIWYPLVIARPTATPRVVKRWMNRVRYLATRELPTSELRSPIERFVDWYAAGGKGKDVSHGDPTGGQDKLQLERIPEELAVALGAIYELDPAALKSPNQFKALLSLDQGGQISLLGENANELIRAKRALHVQQAKFTQWDQIALYAPRFLALWPTIDIQ